MSEPTEYHVKWEIEITAMNPEEAACIALSIQRDQQSGATVFDVTDVADVDKIITRVDAGYEDAKSEEIEKGDEEHGNTRH